MARKKTEESEGQQSLFDLSHYDQTELTGSFSDDFEPELFVKRKGKKSKIDPTWSMTDQELAAFRATYSDSMAAILAKWPPAIAPPDIVRPVAARERSKQRREQRRRSA